MEDMSLLFHEPVQDHLFHFRLPGSLFDFLDFAVHGIFLQLMEDMSPSFMSPCRSSLSLLPAEQPLRLWILLSMAFFCSLWKTCRSCFMSLCKIILSLSPAEQPLRLLFAVHGILLQLMEDMSLLFMSLCKIISLTWCSAALLLRHLHWPEDL